jgi:hypothetical protein
VPQHAHGVPQRRLRAVQRDDEVHERGSFRQRVRRIDRTGPARRPVRSAQRAQQRAGVGGADRQHGDTDPVAERAALHRCRRVIRRDRARLAQRRRVVRGIAVQDHPRRACGLRVLREQPAKRGAVTHQHDGAAHVDARAAQPREIIGQTAMRVHERRDDVAVRGAGVERQSYGGIERRRIGRIAHFAQVEPGGRRAARTVRTVARRVHASVGVQLERELARRVDARAKRLDARLEAVLAQAVARVLGERAVGRCPRVVRVRADDRGVVGRLGR